MHLVPKREISIVIHLSLVVSLMHLPSPGPENVAGSLLGTSHYTVFVPMPRICALYPVAYTTDIDRREISVVYATGYNADIRGMRHKYYIRGIQAREYPQISVVYDPRILAHNLAHSP